MEEIPDNFFVSEEYKEYTETINEYSQRFFVLPAASTDYDLTGQVLWPGAMHLAEYLLKNPEVIRDMTVLEVGAGSGLCGLFCSQIAAKTILTDGNDIVMRLLEKNKPFGRNLEVAMLEWSQDQPGLYLEGLGFPKSYKVIIGADVVYWSNSILPLFNTIQTLLEENGAFYMCYTIRAMNTYRDLMNLTRELGFSNRMLWEKESTFIYEFKKIN